jgi:hypothetical protein
MTTSSGLYPLQGFPLGFRPTKRDRLVYTP